MRSPAQQVSITQDRFGVLEEASGSRHAVRRYTLDGDRGLSVQVLTYGAAVAGISTTDRDGFIDDIVLGFDTLQDYMEQSALSLGGVIGRVSGRVSRASFRMGKDIHFVAQNDGYHHRDGGDAAFHKALWEAELLDDGVLLSHVSPEGAGGFPGAVLAQVSYRLPADTVLPELVVHMTAVSTAPTPLDMSLALPFNLAGHDAGEIGLGEHMLTLDADHYLTTTNTLIPTGNCRLVGGTCLDFRKPVQLNSALNRPVIGGFNHTYCLTPLPDDGLRFVARLEHSDTGRAVEIRTDHCAAHVYSCYDLSPPSELKPDEQSPDNTVRMEAGREGSFYKEHRPAVDELFPDYVDLYKGPEAQDVGNAAEAGDEPQCVEEGERPASHESDVSCRVTSTITLPGLVGKGGVSYYKNGGLMITPQGYPDAINKKNFPSCILMPGEIYERTVTYRFFNGLEAMCRCANIY